MSKNASWKWTEVALRDFSRATFDDISERYRSESPVGLITRFEVSREFVVVNVLSPLNTVFWTCPRRSNILHDGVSGTAVKKMVESVAAPLKHEFKRNNVGLGTFTAGWFEVLRNILRPQDTGAPSLSSDNLNREYYRHRSVAIPSALLAPFQEILQCELEQFGHFAFFPCDECESLRGLDVTLDEVCYEDEISAARLCGTGYTNAPTIRQILFLLKATVEELEAGETFDFNYDTRSIVSGGAAFGSRILKVLSEGELWQMEREILAYRSRLVRLLGWPSHFESVSNIVNPDVFSNTDVASYGITTPYNVIEELSAYLEEMKARYPILCEPCRPG